MSGEPGTRGPGNGLRLTVVIPAYRAHSTLRQCVGAILDSPLSEFISIRLVYDGEEPCGLEAVYPGKVHELKSVGERNAGLARNTGAAGVREGILLFIDADVAPDRASLPKLIEPIVKGEADATVGNYSPEVDGLNFCSKYKQLYIAAVYARRGGAIQNEFWSALGAVRAEAFRAIGGFSAGYSGAAGEDTEFGQRLTKANFRISAVTEATARHLHRFTLGGLIRNDFRKGIRSFLNGVRNGRLSDHRHSSARDVRAVCLAGAFLLCAAASVAGFDWGAALAAASLALWVGARMDLLAAWSRQGKWFLCRALPLAFLLDFVRGAAVAAGLASLASGKLAAAWPGGLARRPLRPRAF